MATLRIENAAKAFGETAVLRDVNLELRDGEFCVVVGGSGCGKSTLLRAVAGLEDLDSGSIFSDDRRIDELPPAKRGVAMVFQSYALYPHLNVFENLAFALRLAKRPAAEIEEAVRRAAAILGLENYLARKPAALSGGQRQRVAIGRAIVRKPGIFLFDEPLSNLDAGLRNRMRFEFAALHRQLGTTTVYVTHDQVEAMTLADRIAVMRAGVIEQVGTPADLYERPENLYVAGFIGSPQMNFLSGRVVATDIAGPALELSHGGRVPLPATGTELAGQPVTLGIRPEHWRPSDGGPGLKLEAEFIEWLGSSVNVHLRHGSANVPIVWHHVEPARVKEGETVSLAPDPRHVHLFDEAGRSILLH